jgi:hypothetical protein
MTEFGLVNDFAMLVCVDDATLEEISKCPLLLNDVSFMIKLIDTDGDNAVITRLELRERRDILNYASILLKRFKTVSWIRRGRIYTRRRKCLDTSQDSHRLGFAMSQ